MGFFTLPRGIGVILLFVGMISYLANGVDIITISLSFAALILFFTPRKAAHAAFERFKDSWSASITLIFVFIIDWLAWALGWMFLKFMQGLAATQLSALEGVRTETAAIANTRVLENNIALVQQQLLVQGSLAVALFAGLVVVYGVSRGLIWLLLRRQKITRHALTGYCLFTLCWWLLWLFPFLVLIALSLSEGLTLLAVSLYAPLLCSAYWHFTGLAYNAFGARHKIGEAITTAFAVGIGSFGSFLPAYALALIPFYAFARVIMTATGWMYGAESFAATPGFIAGLLFSVLFFLWFRPYQMAVMAHVGKKR